jgi:hypothetical protein
MVLILGRTLATPGKTSSSLKLDNNSAFGRFWTSLDDQSDEDDEEEVMNTPTKEEFIAAAARSGIQFEDLIHADNEIAAAEKVSFSSPSSAGFKCPLASKIVNTIVRDRSLKHHGRP